MGQAPDSIKRLVDRFSQQSDQIRSPDYNETLIRVDFINPLMTELGWDIDNRQGFAERYREVVHEDRVKVAGQTKAPDYSFRVGGQRKFFLEAKKPSVDIRNNWEPAYQLRRYAWSAKLACSLLTDFEEFAVYDARIQPKQLEKASVARREYIPYTQYIDRWDFLSGTFSKDAVLKGEFDRYCDSKKGRGAQLFDDAFLGEIEEWRKAIASSLARNNEALDEAALNFAVQRIIDRIIFLRIAEDRGTENVGQLQQLLNGDAVYPRLCGLFRAADARYNSGLFHFAREKDRDESPDTLTPALDVDDKTLKGIIKALYYPQSPYEFTMVSADILGSVYERFLGKVITLTAGHHAKIEEKPEVRKAGGVYYTPTYIVDYIVKNTVGKLLECKTPKEAAKITVLDPACGSGSFLIGAYQFLLDWYHTQYTNGDPASLATGKKPVLRPGRTGGWALTIAERKRILLDHIHGVDLDGQAVEVTKLNLLLKCLEGETSQTLGFEQRLFRERALPDLGRNILCGNSLIDHDVRSLPSFADLAISDRDRVNAFSYEHEFPAVFKTGGFDAVIGNPPYDVLEKDRGEASWPHLVLSEYVRNNADYKHGLGGKLNLFRFFLVRARVLVKDAGRFGMIVPLAVLGDVSCAKTRRSFFNAFNELEADCFPQKDNASRRVFKDAKLSTVVLVGRRDTSSRLGGVLRVRTYPWQSFSDEHKSCAIQLDDLALLDPENLPVPLVDEVSWALCRKLHGNKRVKRLGTMNRYVVTRGEINQTVFRRFITNDYRHARLLKGVEIHQFGFNNELQQGHREWLDEARYLGECPSRPQSKLRRIATQRITGVDDRLRIVAALVNPPCYFADSTNSIVVAENSDLSGLNLLLGLLNSSLFQWRFKITSTNNNVGTNELDCLPVYIFDSTSSNTPEDLATLVGSMITLHARLAAEQLPQRREQIQREIDATDRQIDQLVYQLYGLTDEEIAIVEAAVN